MRRQLCRVTSIVASLVLCLMVTAQAQQPAAPARTEAAAVQGNTAPVVPLEVQLVVSRYQGDKKISSLPYILAVNTNSGNAQLNIGAQVPVPSTTFTPVADKPADDKPAADRLVPMRSYTYRSVGTNIECSAVTADDGRFELTVLVDENSLFTPPGDTRGQSVDPNPVFRNFKTRNKLLLRSGQTRQFTAATDRISGETVRIEVTLTVAK